MADIRQVLTRFRAYQLGTPGASFSHFADGVFTLIEARLTDINCPNILNEMKICEVDRISTLHITSWDEDHCVPSQLEKILTHLRPKKVEFPGYAPTTDSGLESCRLIQRYEQQDNTGQINTQSITPEYINNLDAARQYGYRDVLYNPKHIDAENNNNNSTAQMFRKGSFNVLSLGDLEDSNISARIGRCSIVCNEMDVMILAHHGADNGFTTARLLKKTKPQVAIASANWGNQFEHPDETIRNLLRKCNIPLFTTKRGDILIESIDPHNGCFGVQFWEGSEVKEQKFSAKKNKPVAIRPDNRQAISNRKRRL